MRHVYDNMVEFNDLSNLSMMCPIFQTILNLSGEAENPARLAGEIMVEEELLQRLLAAKNDLNIAVLVAQCHQLACFFGAWYLAGDYMHRIFEIQTAMANLSAHFASTTFRLFWGLTHLAEFRASGARHHMVKYRKVKNMLRTCGEKGVDTYLPALRFFQAEEESLKGNKAAVQSAYDDAIATLADAHYTNYEAMCNEHAANVMMQRFADKEAAAVFYTRSKQKYTEWKAWAKVDHVQKKLDRLAVTEAREIVIPFVIQEEVHR